MSKRRKKKLKRSTLLILAVLIGIVGMCLISVCKKIITVLIILAVTVFSLVKIGKYIERISS